MALFDLVRFNIYDMLPTNYQDLGRKTYYYNPFDNTLIECYNCSIFYYKYANVCNKNVKEFIKLSDTEYTLDYHQTTFTQPDKKFYYQCNTINLDNFLNITKMDNLEKFHIDYDNAKFPMPISGNPKLKITTKHRNYVIKHMGYN